MTPERRAIILDALRESLGAPALVLGASFLGFGALMRANDLPFLAAMLSSMTTWALPGQVTMVELYLTGASVASIGIGVTLANLRILPLVVSLMPIINAPGVRRWQLYLLAHFVAVTLWTVGMRRCPELPQRERLPYLMTAALAIWSACVAATATGYLLASKLPAVISIGLVFMNPVYFGLVLIGELSKPHRAVALALGATLGPAFHLVNSDWGMLVAGVVAGTIGFLVLKFRLGHQG